MAHHFLSDKGVFRCYAIVLAVVVCPSAALSHTGSEAPYVRCTCEYIQKVGKPFPVRVDVQPPALTPVEVRMVTTGNIVYSENRFLLEPGEKKMLEATVIQTQTGLDWVHGVLKEAEQSEQGYAIVNTGYLGELKLSSAEPLPYESETTLFLRIIGPDGRALRLDAPQSIQLQSSDAVLTGENLKMQEGVRTLQINAREIMSPQFRIKPGSIFGGSVHLNAALTYGEDILTEESFTFSAQPSWLLLLGLAVIGALLHAFYKIARLQTVTWHRVGAVAMTSAVAGCLGYLVTNYDLFGLKLDPNVLRTYPLVGFVFSYFGVEAFLSTFLHRPKASAPEKLKAAA